MVLEGLEEGFRRIINTSKATLTLRDLFTIEGMELMLVGHDESCRDPPTDLVDIDRAEAIIETIEMALEWHSWPRYPSALRPDLPLVVIELYHAVLLVLASKFSIIAMDMHAIEPFREEKEEAPFTTETDIMNEADFAAMMPRLTILQRFSNSLPRVESAMLAEVESWVDFLQNSRTTRGISQRSSFRNAWQYTSKLSLISATTADNL